MATGLRGTVLVVDDDDSMREAIEALLDAAGVDAILYESAEALLADARSADAACVVSDLQLPGMSGLDLLGRLRARNARTPVIVITAHDSPATRAKAIVEATTHFRDADILAKVSRGLGAPMTGIAMDEINQRYAERGW